MTRLGRFFVQSDITRVLTLDVSKAPAENTMADLQCRLLDVDGLQQLRSSQAFSVTEAFVDDFVTQRFTGVAAHVDGRVVGVCFFVRNSVAARHNRGGEQFKGIGISLPPHTQYLFKVEVLPDFRGRRVHAAMTAFAIANIDVGNLRAIVTTTHWRNKAYLASVYRQGFSARGMASELIVAGKHLFFISPPFDVIESEIDGEQGHRVRLHSAI